MVINKNELYISYFDFVDERDKNPSSTWQRSEQFDFSVICLEMKDSDNFQKLRRILTSDFVSENWFNKGLAIR